MNKCVLVGNLTRDPEMRQTQSGLSVASFTVACQRRFANQQGEREADFISCIAWRQTADFVNRYFHKGSKIGLTGSIQTRTYDAKDGTKHYVTEVLVDEVEFVQPKDSSTGTQGNGSYGQSPAQRQQTQPVNQQMSLEDQGFTEVQEDDDLPF